MGESGENRTGRSTPGGGEVQTDEEDKLQGEETEADVSKDRVLVAMETPALVEKKNMNKALGILKYLVMEMSIENQLRESSLYSNYHHSIFH